jgi:hypothetical protein
MSMSRKQYNGIAKIVREEREAASMLTPDMQSAVLVSTFIMAGKLATFFAHDSSNFNHERFYKACGFDE